MDKIPLDEGKVRFYAQIQENLCNLSEDSSDEDIDKLINQIPAEYLTQKGDLMKICELFASYARFHSLKSKRSTFKLLDKIMSHLFYQMNRHFSGVFLVAIYILNIGSIKKVLFLLIMSFYWLKYNQTFTEENIKEYKKRREVHLKWLQNSCDYNDSIYDQIETNRFRLSIKRDDIDTFQRLLSESNHPIESNISELTFECQIISRSVHSLLDYSILCKALKNFKFLILNDAKLTELTVYYTISSNNYEIIHIIESKITELFSKNALKTSLYFHK